MHQTTSIHNAPFRIGTLTLFCISYFGLCQFALADADEFSNTVSLNLAQFVRFSQQQSFANMQYQQRINAEQLHLDIAKERFHPTINLSSQIGREQKDQYSTTYIDNNTNGIDSTAAVDWLLPSGTSIGLSYQYQHGTLKGLTSLGISDDPQHTIITSVNIEQPIIGGLWQNQQQLPAIKAQAQWQYYQQEGQLLRLQTQRQAFNGFMDFQEQHDKITLLQKSWQHARFRAKATAARHQQGQIVKAELLQAQLEEHQRFASLTEAKNELELIQQRLSAQFNTRLTIILKPLKNLRQLSLCTANVELDNNNYLQHHPQLVLKQLATNIARNSFQQSRFDLWPQVNLFYQHQEKQAVLSQNTSEQSWGIKASFQPNDKNTQLQKTQLKNSWVNAIYQQQETLKQLLKDWQLYKTQNHQLHQQLHLAKQGTALALQAFEHSQKRYQHGTDSVLQVKQSQDAWVNQRLYEITANKNLLANRLELYYLLGATMPFASCM